MICQVNVEIKKFKNIFKIIQNYKSLYNRSFFENRYFFRIFSEFNKCEPKTLITSNQSTRLIFYFRYFRILYCLHPFIPNVFRHRTTCFLLYIFFYPLSSIFAVPVGIFSFFQPKTSNSICCHSLLVSN